MLRYGDGAAAGSRWGKCSIRPSDRGGVDAPRPSLSAERDVPCANAYLIFPAFKSGFFVSSSLPPLTHSHPTSRLPCILSLTVSKPVVALFYVL